MLAPFRSAALAVALLASAPAAHAAETPSFTITLQNHKFEPAELQVPAGTKIELKVVNKDTTAAEFESSDLHREKVVSAGGTVTLYVGPLRAGSYEYFNDFDPKTRGRVIAK